MELRKKAEDAAKNYINDPDIETLCVTFPDQAVYVNNDIQVMRKHCADHNLEIIVLKGEEYGPKLPNVDENPVEVKEKKPKGTPKK